MQILGHAQGVANAMAHGVDRRHVEPVEFGIQKTDIEGSIVDDQFGTPNEIEKFGGDIGETRFVLKEFKTDSVNRERSGVDVSLRVYIAVKMAIGQPAVAHFDTAYFDNAVSEFVLKAGGFCIEKNLAHD
jgi:hypothetical protein